MTLHHVLGLAVAGAVGLVKLVGAFLGELLGEVVSDGILALVLAPFRRKQRPRMLSGLQREAEETRRALWAEVLATARARTPGPEPDPHVLRLRKSPTPRREAKIRSPADPGGGAFRPPRRSTGG